MIVSVNGFIAVRIKESRRWWGKVSLAVCGSWPVLFACLLLLGIG